MTEEQARYASDGDVKALLNASPVGQHLLAGEFVLPIGESTSLTDGAAKITINADGFAELKVYSKTAGGYYTFTGLLAPQDGTTDLKDALVNMGIIEDDGATNLDLHEGDLYAHDVILTGNLQAADGALTVDSLTTTGAMTVGTTLNVSGNVNFTLDLTVRNIAHTGTLIGFYGGSVAVKPTVTGSRGGNAALASLLTALSGLGLLTDSSS